MKELAYFLTYLKRIVILIALYTLSRIFFYYNNLDSLTETNIFEIIEGMRFDLSVIAYINIPLLILLLLPINIRTHQLYQKITNWIFYTTNIPFVILNNIDIEYFRFTQKRSTIDFLELIQLGEDVINITPTYIKEYWIITLFSIAQIWIILRIKKTPKNNIQSIPKSIMCLIIGISLVIISARGGLQLKPIKAINAGELTQSENNSLILNTPFCIIHSLDSEKLPQHEYYTQNEIEKIYSPIHKNKLINKDLSKTNVIIIIMESYSKEFIGYYNSEKGHTPFLDSLIQKSLVFTNAFSNGLKSIEALPAITASIPTLMNEPFITSEYAQNKFQSLASILNKEGYNTSFYHGGHRGTMGFYAYCKKAGFQNYYGLEEYNNKTDFDGSWGIFDVPFMKYFANQIKDKKEPFFSTFFSLSSHPPYVLPENHNPESNKIGILETITYSDYAMKIFFNQIKNEKWFSNTIFIITADHTAGRKYNNKYKNKIGRYAIPMIIFKGDSSLQGVNNNIVQQIDIMPTVLDLINYPKPFFSFGKSMFSEEQWAISKLQENYYFITPQGIIKNKEENYQKYSNWELNKKTIIKEKYVKQLKAIKQDYNHRIGKNKIHYEN